MELELRQMIDGASLATDIDGASMLVVQGEDALDDLIHLSVDIASRPHANRRDLVGNYAAGAGLSPNNTTCEQR